MPLPDPAQAKFGSQAGFDTTGNLSNGSSPHDPNKILQLLGSHLESLGQMIAQVTADSTAGAVNVHAEDALGQLVTQMHPCFSTSNANLRTGDAMTSLAWLPGVASDRLHDPRSGSPSSVLHSAMMQQAASEGSLPVSWTCNTAGILASEPNVWKRSVQVAKPMEPVVPEKSKAERPSLCSVLEGSLMELPPAVSFFPSGAGTQSIFSGAEQQHDAHDWVFQLAFRELDEQGTGVLSLEQITAVITNIPSPTGNVSYEATGRALTAISRMAAQANGCKFQGPSKTLDYDAFLWLLDTGCKKRISRRTVYDGYGNEEDAVLVVFQALKMFCDGCAEKGQDKPESHRNGSEMASYVNDASDGVVTQSLVPTHSDSCKLSAGKWRKGVYSKSISTVCSEDDPIQVKIKRLEIVVSAVILFNLLQTGMSVDVASNSFVWSLLENLTKLFFLWEALYKMKLLGICVYFTGKDCCWNIFDFTLVVISFVDFVSGSAEGASWLKLLKLSRLGRIVRLLRFPMFAEMRMMVEGVFSGLRVLFWAIMLFLLFIYLLAIILNNSMKDTSSSGCAENESNDQDLESFSSIYWSMFTVFRCFTGDCSSNTGRPLIVNVVDSLGAAYYIGFILTYLFMSLGLLNLIMAMYVEDVKQSAHMRRQDSLNRDRENMECHLRHVVNQMIREDRFYKITHRNINPVTESDSGTCLRRCFIKFLSWVSRIRGIKIYNDPFQRYDSRRRDNDGAFGGYAPISRQVFINWLTRKDMQKLLVELDVDCNSPLQLFDVLDADMSGFLEAEELIDGFMNLRGPLQKCDMVATLLSTRAIQRQLWEIQEEMLQLLKDRGLTTSNKKNQK